MNHFWANYNVAIVVVTTILLHLSCGIAAGCYRVKKMYGEYRTLTNGEFDLVIGILLFNCLLGFASFLSLLLIMLLNGQEHRPATKDGE